MTTDNLPENVIITYTFSESNRETIIDCIHDLVVNGWKFESEIFLEDKKVKLTFSTNNKELIAKYVLNPIK